MALHQETVQVPTSIKLALPTSLPSFKCTSGIFLRQSTSWRREREAFPKFVLFIIFSHFSECLPSPNYRQEDRQGEESMEAPSGQSVLQVSLMPACFPGKRAGRKTICFSNCLTSSVWARRTWGLSSATCVIRWSTCIILAEVGWLMSFIHNLVAT